ncbi:hypothetical protein MVES1_003743 [Malassezia vespertilionis]|uniref:Uncharacterized protein n=1 Tax=Malassezia vespertilionis TaxID=2020962 RepID=A0A2N1J8G3_9BASI|nr:uncharacterized protein MVES1_003743 [Malassezia vespertilionis]PKI82839.1 hypothetical protein MVES_003301 [Malassezia vespertilionis]WFD08371.1 hypothetical protein MVES1_003743 [Malassezia vespertilionis]
MDQHAECGTKSDYGSQGGDVWHNADPSIEDPNVAGTMLEHAHNKEEHSRNHAIFDAVHKHKKNKPKNEKYLQEHGFDLPVKLSHLSKSPVVRQWIYREHLYREADARLPSRFELFFDLMFVGIAHIVAESASESSSGLNVLKFFLEYFPTFAVWSDVRTFLNVSGTDDIKERLGLLAVMILLTGYSANAGGIQVRHCGTREEMTASDFYCPIPSALEKRAVESNKASPTGYLGSGYWFMDGFNRLIRSAVAFYLVLRLMRILLYLYYGVMLPKFRAAMWTNAVVRVLISAIYLAVLFFHSASAIISLMFVGMFAEMFTPFLTWLFLLVLNRWKRKKGSHLYIPAVSQEHAMERVVQFAIVVVGEMIINSTYTATKATAGVSHMFGRSALAVTCSFMLIWLYYDADSSRTFQHALRRNPLTSLLFSLIHFPLTASLILSSSALKKLIATQEAEGGYLWYWSGSCGVTLLCIGIMGILHRNLDKHRSTVMPRRVRLSARFIVAILVTLLPLMRKHWATLDFLGTCTGMLAFLVLFETCTKIGAVGRRYDEHNAALVRRAKLKPTVESEPSKRDDARKARAQLRAMDAVRRPAPAESTSEHPCYEKEPLGKLTLKRTISWHPYGGLSLAEHGEEDVGMEGELGHMQVKELTSGQRWAFAA